jgi:hypothetical protein
MTVLYLIYKIVFHHSMSHSEICLILPHRHILIEALKLSHSLQILHEVC